MRPHFPIPMVVLLSAALFGCEAQQLDAKDTKPIEAAAPVPAHDLSPTERLSRQILDSLEQRSTPVPDAAPVYDYLTCEPTDVTLFHVEGNQYVGTIEYSFVGASDMAERATGTRRRQQNFSCNVEVLSDGTNWRLDWDANEDCLASPMHSEVRGPWTDYSLTIFQLPVFLAVESCYCIEPKRNGQCERLDLLLAEVSKLNAQ